MLRAFAWSAREPRQRKGRYGAGPFGPFCREMQVCAKGLRDVRGRARCLHVSASARASTTPSFQALQAGTLAEAGWRIAWLLRPSM